MKRILLIGATSAIAEATARLWAGRGDSIYLLGRDALRLAQIAADLRVRGAGAVQHAVLDVRDHARHAATLDAALAQWDGLDVVLVAHGSLPDQAACERDSAAALEALEINALSVVSLLTHLANRLAVQGSGTIAVIGSVAGDRGRQSNYVYGTAKAAVAVFLQGLRNRLHASGVRVLTIKPGFVDTPMTAAFAKGLLWASPQDVARGIVGAVDRGRDVAYLPGFWRWIMLAVRSIPENVFKRMRL
ncbi:SDR family oxidoreductase [uncultured Ramlibacter sp.]|uniref:SDR family oxidoreductase n=1 Tax=uncultured Ramlibacter sp. TaxID=260755 RepID=UPI00261A51E8|nr:SDR family oxidoreductase [uncultured Ramlibacter sp.]